MTTETPSRAIPPDPGAAAGASAGPRNGAAAGPSAGPRTGDCDCATAISDPSAPIAGARRDRSSDGPTRPPRPPRPPNVRADRRPHAEAPRPARRPAGASARERVPRSIRHAPPRPRAPSKRAANRRREPATLTNSASYPVRYDRYNQRITRIFPYFEPYALCPEPLARRGPPQQRDSANGGPAVQRDDRPAVPATRRTASTERGSRMKRKEAFARRARASARMRPNRAGTGRLLVRGPAGRMAPRRELPDRRP